MVRCKRYTEQMGAEARIRGSGVIEEVYHSLASLISKGGRWVRGKVL